MSYYKLPFVFLAFVIVGGVSGWLAGPVIARLDQRVQLAQRVAFEQAAEQAGTPAEMTVDTEAWYETGETPAELYDRARAVTHDFAVGTALVGVFVGLAAAFKVVGLRMVPESNIYDIHHGRCVSCARCFRACPVEQERLKELGEQERKPKL